jgi:hypothetical protein
MKTQDVVEAVDRLLALTKVEVREGEPTLTESAAQNNALYQKYTNSYSPYCDCDLCPCCGKPRRPWGAYPWGVWPHWQTWTCLDGSMYPKVEYVNNCECK